MRAIELLFPRAAETFGGEVMNEGCVDLRQAEALIAIPQDRMVGS